MNDDMKYDRVSDKLLADLALGVKAYPHEARNMARELQELRKKVASAAVLHYLANPSGWCLLP